MSCWGGQGHSSEGWSIDYTKLAAALVGAPCTKPGAEWTLWLPYIYIICIYIYIYGIYGIYSIYGIYGIYVCVVYMIYMCVYV